jgi:hypothetical protein
MNGKAGTACLPIREVQTSNRSSIDRSSFRPRDYRVAQEISGGYNSSIKLVDLDGELLVVKQVIVSKSVMMDRVIGEIEIHQQLDHPTVLPVLGHQINFDAIWGTCRPPTPPG